LCRYLKKNREFNGLFGRLAGLWVERGENSSISNGVPISSRVGSQGYGWGYPGHRIIANEQWADLTQPRPGSPTGKNGSPTPRRHRRRKIKIEHDETAAKTQPDAGPRQS
jgi:hypothetical protein